MEAPPQLLHGARASLEARETAARHHLRQHQHPVRMLPARQEALNAQYLQTEELVTLTSHLCRAQPTLAESFSRRVSGAAKQYAVAESATCRGREAFRGTLCSESPRLTSMCRRWRYCGTQCSGAP